MEGVFMIGSKVDSMVTISIDTKLPINFKTLIPFCEHDNVYNAAYPMQTKILVHRSKVKEAIKILILHRYIEFKRPCLLY